MEWGYGRGTLLSLTVGIILMIIGMLLMFSAKIHVDPGGGKIWVDPALAFGLGLFILGSMFFGLAVGIFVAWLVFSRELPELFKR